MQMLDRAEERCADGKVHDDAAAQVEHAVFMQVSSNIECFLKLLEVVPILCTVFVSQSYIPRTLAAVRDAEGDVAKVMQGDTSGLYYAALTGMDSIGHGVAAKARALAEVPANVLKGYSPTVSFSISPLADLIVNFPEAPTSGSSQEIVDSTAAAAVHMSKEYLPLVPTVTATTSDDEDSASSHESLDSDDASALEDGSGAAVFTKRLASKDERRLHKAAIKEQNREKRKLKMPKKEKKRKMAANTHK